MSDPVTNVEIEDVLSSIRRLVTADTESDKKGAEHSETVRPKERVNRFANLNLRGLNASSSASVERKAPESKLVLTPSQRVDDAFRFGAGNEDMPDPYDDVAFAFNDFTEEADLADAKQDVQDALENDIPDLNARARAEELAPEDSRDAIRDDMDAALEDSLEETGCDSIDEVAEDGEAAETAERAEDHQLLESAELSDDAETTEETPASEGASVSDDPDPMQQLEFLESSEPSEDAERAHDAAHEEDGALTEEPDAEDTGAHAGVLELSDPELSEPVPEPEHDADHAAMAEDAQDDEAISETEATDASDQASEDINDLDVPEFLLRPGAETDAAEDTDDDIASDDAPVRSFPSFAEVEALKQAETDTEDEPVALSVRLESLEAAVAEQAEDWEPDLGDQESLSAAEVEPLPWQDIEVETADMSEAVAEPEPAVDEVIEDAVYVAAEEAVDAAVKEAIDEDTVEALDMAPDGAADGAPDWAAEDLGDAEADLETHDMHEDLAPNPEAPGPQVGPSDSWFGGDAVIDEVALRDMIGEIVREELQGALGERITRNVRKLVRREIHRVLLEKGLD